MDTSLNICFSGMKFVMVVHNIPLEGTMSQILDLGLSFYVKKQVTFGHYLKLYFLDFIKKKLRPK